MGGAGDFRQRRPDCIRDRLRVGYQRLTLYLGGVSDIDPHKKDRCAMMLEPLLAELQQEKL